ncbi:butyryl-CoA dehydrogenase [Lewinella marina]|uniref:Acetoin dehydrogenase n=1 Tax=Neolewinella marina TaxID=438751 RepID=A0A2G0CEV6_9BACT|nr:SDR family oxidoreductase [Neolewinella marina]NJB87226.1 butyryl-CoA dehydrogenase [Neolewinella marina]PHK98447.1 acetoin dehydrogenase [Neolewinella marina]
MKDFQGKVVVITGAGSGIGREMALQLAGCGAVLALNDVKEAELEETWAALPDLARGLRRTFDVGERLAVQDFANAVKDQLGRVDVVVNNAGFSVRPQPVIYSRVEDYERTLKVNLWGVIYGSLAFLPYLREQSDSSLVNVSSVFGLYAFPGTGPYNVSKFGVRGFTETLRVEMGDRMHVCCVHPGGIATNIHRNVEIDDPAERERFIRTFDKRAHTTAAEAAQQIIRGIERRDPRVLIGRDAYWVDKITRLLPARYERLLTRWLDRDRFLSREG